VSATKDGFALAPRRQSEIVVLARPSKEHQPSWPSSPTAIVVEFRPGACAGGSQRTVQRALDSLAAAGKVQSYGRARARRWMTQPLPDSHNLVTPGPLPSD